MTVVNHNARNQYISTNGQTIFNYAFGINSANTLKVYQTPAGQPADDASQLLTYITDYAVTGVGNPNGGTIVLVTGAALDDVITIQGNVPPQSVVTFTPGGVIGAANLNLGFDNDVLIYQTILGTLDNLVPKYQDSQIVPATWLILPALGPNQVAQMNAAGTNLIASTMVSGEIFASHTAGQGASLIGLNPVGTVQDLANAGFILKTANATAPNAQALGALSSGILKNTTASGVLSISNALTSIDAINIAADQMLYATGTNTYAATGLTAFARTLLDDANAATARTTLGVTIGTNVQAWNATLQSISALGTAANKMIYTTGVNTWAETDVSAFSRSLFDEADAAAWRTALGVGPVAAALLIVNNLSELTPTAATARANIGVAIGSDVQAWNANLDSFSALGTAADQIAYTTGLNTWAATALTAFMRTLLDDGDAATAAATLGVLPLAGGTMTGNLFLNANPTMGSQAATKDYVDSVTQSDQAACLCATAADMPTWTYSNGASGVGATLTAPTNGASTFDGIVPINGNSVFVLNQTTNPAWQGPYTIVQGTGGTPTVLTRRTDWDTASEMQAGDTFTVVQGTTYGASQWMFSQVNPITVGTTALTFQQMVGIGALLKANNLSDLNNAATARTNLGVAIGTNVQAFNAALQSISGLTTATGTMIYTTASNTYATTASTAFGRGALNVADAAAGRTYFGVAIGTDVQAHSALLDSLAAITANNGGIIYSTASAFALLNGVAAAGRMLQSGNSAAPTWSTAAYPATASTANKLILSDGTNFITSTNPLTASGLQAITSSSQMLVQQVYTQTSTVASSTATMPFGATVPTTSNGFQILSLSITPKSATNILRIEGNLLCGTTLQDNIACGLFQDAITTAIATGSQGTISNDVHTLPFVYFMVAGTTSSTTFKFRIGATAGVTTFNGSNSVQFWGTTGYSNMRITEYTP